MAQIVPYTRQVEPDYLDNLLPGYRFCPTDSELILHYLKRKIETGEHRGCRIYEVNLYDYTPEQLTNQYRACDNKWYFLTPVSRKYVNGFVANRKITGDTEALWKTTQKGAPVYFDASRRQVIGSKRSLAFYEKKGCKTPWLMHEYTLNDTNCPVKRGRDGNKVLTDWVLCTIYKKNNNTVEAAHQMSISTTNFQSSNGDISSSSKINPHVQATQLPLVYPTPVASTTVVPFNASEDIIRQQNQSMKLIATDSFQFSKGASNSISVESLVHHAAQPCAYTSSEILKDVSMDDWDHIFQHNDFSATKADVDTSILEYEICDMIFVNELTTSELDS
ncbi:hypothetical protein QVD17_17937 [Tagetes erecta]|uniref:NAC domain-containing protein n=1 Tax=Tagetes erecta TaxID=13708 RepID=A0AAD8KK87_TARER|nr:hypothetical protein QVD17_17937 [Tagetes erecta]